MSLYKRFAVCAFMFEFVTPPTINKSSNEYIYELFEVRDAGDMGKGVFANTTSQRICLGYCCHTVV